MEQELETAQHGTSCLDVLYTCKDSQEDMRQSVSVLLWWEQSVSACIVPSLSYYWTLTTLYMCISGLCLQGLGKQEHVMLSHWRTLDPFKRSFLLPHRGEGAHPAGGKKGHKSLSVHLCMPPWEWMASHAPRGCPAMIAEVFQQHLHLCSGGIGYCHLA